MWAVRVDSRGGREGLSRWTIPSAGVWRVAAFVAEDDGHAGSGPPVRLPRVGPFALGPLPLGQIPLSVPGMNPNRRTIRTGASVLETVTAIPHDLTGEPDLALEPAAMSRDLPVGCTGLSMSCEFGLAQFYHTLSDGATMGFFGTVQPPTFVRRHRGRGGDGRAPEGVGFRCSCRLGSAFAVACVGRAAPRRSPFGCAFDGEFQVAMRPIRCDTR